MIDRPAQDGGIFNRGDDEIVTNDNNETPQPAPPTPEEEPDVDLDFGNSIGGNVELRNNIQGMDRNLEGVNHDIDT